MSTIPTARPISRACGIGARRWLRNEDWSRLQPSRCRSFLCALSPVESLSGDRACRKLKEIAPVPISKVFFCNSGSEANDTQIKLVWYLNNARGKPQKKKIISRVKAYHGVTVAAASLTGCRAIIAISTCRFRVFCTPVHTRRTSPTSRGPNKRVLKPVYLDELPQLVNVLRGDMSLVGPRPWPAELVERQVARGVDYRLRVPAGWTGAAQVSKGLDAQFEQLDLDYVALLENGSGTGSRPP